MRFLWIVTLAFSLGLVTGPAAAQISKEQALALRAVQAPEAGFNAYLLALAKAKPEFAALAKTFIAKESLTEDQRHTIYRLLGVYTLAKYGDEAIALLKHLVRFDTSIKAGVPQHENPQMIAAGKELAKVAKAFGLEFLNVDERVYEITLAGRDADLIGIHAHLDVVPVNPELWVLEDGTRLNPFEITTLGNRMYARGAQDDKNGIVVSLFAMRVIKEEKLPLRQTLRLIVDTTEETSGTAIPYYLERRPSPPYNLALDGGYPVVIAEKGYGTVMATFPLREAEGDGAKIIAMTGGLATNQIPSQASVTFAGSDLEQLRQQLDALAKVYAAEQPEPFGYAMRMNGGLLVLTFKGISAHSSAPQTGLNPVSRLMEFIALNQEGLGLAQNHFTDAARYAEQNWGVDYLGTRFGIGFTHDFMGPLTAAQTYIKLESDSLKTAVNIRLPVGKAPADLKNEVAHKLAGWKQSSGVDVNIEHSQADPMYRNPEGAWVQNLLAVASENLGIEPKFGSSSGGTSAHNLPNGVQFGLAVPGERYTGHNANEYKTVDQFLLDLQIITEAFIRVANLPRMQ